MAYTYDSFGLVETEDKRLALNLLDPPRHWVNCRAPGDSPDFQWEVIPAFNAQDLTYMGIVLRNRKFGEYMRGVYQDKWKEWTVDAVPEGPDFDEHCVFVPARSDGSSYELAWFPDQSMALFTPDSELGARIASYSNTNGFRFYFPNHA